MMMQQGVEHHSHWIAWYLYPTFRFYVTLEDSFFTLSIPKVDNQWIHLVMNYIDEGFEVYQDGGLVEAELNMGIIDATPGDGKLVLGKQYTDEDYKNVNMDLDELVFFNRKLTEQEVLKLYNV